jgi:hypothetical protein
MTLSKAKYIFYAALISTVAFFGYKQYYRFKNILNENVVLHQDLIGQTEKYRQLSDHAALLEINYKNSDQIKADAEAKFKDEISQMQGKIKILSDATFLIKEKARESGRSDLVFSNTEGSFVMNELRFDNGEPVGYVLIFSDGRVVSKIYQAQIHVDTLVSSSDNSGRYSIVSKAQYILKSPSLSPGGQVWLNKPVELDITGGTAEIDPTVTIVKSFKFWNPKLNANLNLDTSGVYPGLGISLMSFGTDKDDLDYKFLELGFEYKNSSIQGMIIPVLWRPFNGLLSNTYLGPGMSTGLTGSTYFLSLAVGL